MNPADDKKETSPTELVEVIITALNNLDRLARLASSNEAGQMELRRQIGQVASSLQQLSHKVLEGDEVGVLEEAFVKLSQNLGDLAVNATAGPILPPSFPPPPLSHDLPDQDFVSRVAMTLPSYLSHLQRPADETEPSDGELRKVIVGSLERTDSALSLLKQAESGFDANRWEVLDMGVNVPILVFSNAVREKRPSVVVLVMSGGHLISETAWMIGHLRKKVNGLKVVVVGPPLAKIDNLAARLEADLFSNIASEAAQLAEQAVSVVARIDQPLRLDMDEMEAEIPEEFTFKEADGERMKDEG